MPDELSNADELTPSATTYRELRGVYKGFAKSVETILRASIPHGNPIHSIQSRAKSVASFERKAGKIRSNEPSTAKYPDPLREITDLTGVRVITFFPKTIEVVRRIV